jgi:hypothetical protein
MHENIEDHIGETCPNCETRHRLIESLPNRVLSEEEVDTLRESGKFEYIGSVSYMNDGVKLPDKEEHWTTDNLVIAKGSNTQVLSRHDKGWIVEIEEEVHEDESPYEAGVRMHKKAQRELQKGMKSISEQRQDGLDIEDSEVIRWPDPEEE